MSMFWQTRASFNRAREADESTPVAVQKSDLRGGAKPVVKKIFGPCPCR